VKAAPSLNRHAAAQELGSTRVYEVEGALVTAFPEIAGMSTVVDQTDRFLVAGQSAASRKIDPT
jgi:hypothetical protein